MQPQRRESPAGSRGRRLCAGVFGAGVAALVAILVTILVAILALSAGPAQAQGSCEKLDTRSEQFLTCVVANLKAHETSQPLVTTDPIYKYLATLAANVGFAGKADDLDELKRRSTLLKEHPKDNRNAIIALDNAISAHRSELRSMVLPETMNPEPGNAFVDFVRRKLAYLLTPGTAFYDRGPYEVLVRAHLGTAFQEAYFLGNSLRLDDTPELRQKLINRGISERKTFTEQEVQGVDDILTRLTAPEFAYLPDDQRRFWVNDYRFRRATILYALGSRAAFKDALRDLAYKNQEFSLGTRDLDHVYLYKVYDTPYELVLSAEEDKSGRAVTDVKISDPSVLKRFYNPAQLALVACSMIESAGPDHLTAFAKTIGDVALSDYYVVVAGGNDPQALQQLSSAIRSRLAKNTSQLGEVAAKVRGLEVGGFSRTINNGAAACSIENAVRDRIFAPFNFELSIEKIAGFGKFDYQLLMGGRLNADQARAVSTFLNRTIFPDVQGERRRLNFDIDAYIARMRLDG
jgi:hypothetical protein